MAEKIKIEWFPFYIEKYLKDTDLLNEEEHGLYLKLLLHLYTHDGKIPKFEENLKRISSKFRLNLNKFKRIYRNIEDYFEIKDGNLTHSSVTKHLDKCIDLISKKRKAANIRWHPDEHADDMQVHDAGACADAYDSNSNSNSLDLYSSELSTKGGDLSRKGESFPPVDNSKNPAPKTKKKLSKKVNGVDTTDTWWAYNIAYQKKYNIKPVRNAKTNGQMKQFVERVGKDIAPSIAVYYVQNANPFYACKNHVVGMMLMDAEKLYTDYQQTQQDRE